ncbi:PAS domain-containing protein [Streptomyces sp. TRM43335]|uniref:PAS domain-containing protein n=1 Tax=Streptomyces taklimakanensis TaxID=2569853 RepID=A0A6G2B633_9ACTN|nr:PAS domain-containing protein [Streptomyces taklimakanensis]
MVTTSSTAASRSALSSPDPRRAAVDSAVPAVPRDARDGRRRRTYTAHASTRDTTVTAVEAEFAEAFGLSPGRICGRDLCDLLLARSPANLRNRFADLAEGRSNRFTERVTGRDDAGRTFSANLTAIAVAGPDGPAGLVILLRHTGNVDPAECDDRRTLSEIDARVLEGVAGGASTVQLAGRLYMSRQGVEYRVGRLLRRFDAPNRPALVARAHGLGLFAEGQWPPRVLSDFVE